MVKLIALILTIFAFTTPVFASGNNFVNVVNPVRGGDFWSITNQQPETVVEGQIQILNKLNLPATWLLRFDALENQKIITDLNSPIDQKGLFLEVTPTWAKEAGVTYQTGPSWHDAGSALLTGYSPSDRIKLIDSAFNKFKQTVGFYPKAVGAWWIDAYSLDYMQKKYGITSSMIVSDQYSTDNYQIWGQYFSTPYYPALKNALHPAQTVDNKIPVVMLQWAPRDPVNSYGNGVFESTFSVQPNDYIDYHKLDAKYFTNLLDLYQSQKFNKFSEVVVGLENTYQWSNYSAEYQNQMQVLANQRNSGKISLITMDGFASFYKQAFPDLSPTQIIVGSDPLGTDKKVVWYMNPYYRAGWFYNNEGALFRDIRQYVDGQEELCFSTRCSTVNFATSATRVLDEVSFGQKLLLDSGKISNFDVTQNADKFVLTYQNEAGKQREVGFLPRDIEIDGKVSSIDTTILNATKNSTSKSPTVNQTISGPFIFSVSSTILESLKFLLFITFGMVIPGIVFTRLAINQKLGSLNRLFLSAVSGLVVFTLIFYLLAEFKLTVLIYVYLILSLLIFLWFYVKDTLSMALPKIKSIYDLGLVIIVTLGTIFQVLPTFQSGLRFGYGMGLWGPNTHDGMWHLALINQLLKQVPPQNPIFARTILKNYHYLYDLLVAATVSISKVPATDLVFRFYPILFSLLLGIGSYYLISRLFNQKSLIKIKLISLFSLYFIYFAGSFGWIVEYIHQKHWGGESAFWANQSISFNLNPPFAISLVIMIALLQLLPYLSTKNRGLIILLSIISGALISFKAYAGILVLSTLLTVAILKRSMSHLSVFVLSFLLSALLFLSNFSVGQSLIMVSPFWFVNSMIDAPDRVGWYRLSLTRNVGLATGNWFKFIGAEIISLVIFIAGNLGTRVFALISLIKLKAIWKNNHYLFLLILGLFSLLIPIIFIQAGNPWNTIQFIYYFLYLAALINGVVMVKMLTKFNKVVGFLLCFVILTLTPINAWTTAKGYLNEQPHAYISNDELSALQFLKDQPDGVVLTYPYDSNLKGGIAQPWPLVAYDSTAYVAAFSNKPSFLEDEAQNQILLTNNQKRLIASKDFFTQPNPDLNFLRKNQIKYIYLPKIYNVRVDQSQGSIKTLLENSQVVIYEIN